MKIKHALFIDDSDIDNFVSEHIIRDANVAKRVTLVASATEAMEYLHSVKDNPDEFPDVIFLDIRMPLLDGFDFLDEFMKMPEHILSTATVIMLTASNHPKDIERAFKYPVVKDYLTKPLDAKILMNL